jgi:hypothetical protein
MIELSITDYMFIIEHLALLLLLFFFLKKISSSFMVYSTDQVARKLNDRKMARGFE